MEKEKQSQSLVLEGSVYSDGPGTDLDEHEPLHGLHPLQQHDAGLERPTQVLVSRVRVPHCTETKPVSCAGSQIAAAVCVECKTMWSNHVRAAEWRSQRDVFICFFFFFYSLIQETLSLLNLMCDMKRKGNQIGTAPNSPTQHFWQLFVSGILLDTANFL